MTAGVYAIVNMETMPGPICPCGHPVAGHFLAGCLDIQWFDETSDVFCACRWTEDEAAIYTRTPPPE